MDQRQAAPLTGLGKCLLSGQLTDDGDNRSLAYIVPLVYAARAPKIRNTERRWMLPHGKAEGIKVNIRLTQVHLTTWFQPPNATRRQVVDSRALRFRTPPSKPRKFFLTHHLAFAVDVIALTAAKPPFYFHPISKAVCAEAMDNLQDLRLKDLPCCAACGGERGAQHCSFHGCILSLLRVGGACARLIKSTSHTVSFGQFGILCFRKWSFTPFVEYFDILHESGVPIVVHALVIINDRRMNTLMI